jgi:hypothetical protein
MALPLLLGCPPYRIDSKTTSSAVNAPRLASEMLIAVTVQTVCFVVESEDGIRKRDNMQARRTLPHRYSGRNTIELGVVAWPNATP